MKNLLLLPLLCFMVTSCAGLRCLKCEGEDRCSGSSLTLKCAWGIVKDVCNCCDVCAKGPGDKCGGPWSIHGKCGRDLICQKSSEDDEEVCKTNGQQATNQHPSW